MGCCNSNVNSPTTSISIVIQQLCKRIRIEDSKNYSSHWVEILNREWYYRLIDLLEIEKNVLDKLNMPTVLEHQFTKYIAECKLNEEFTSFTETKIQAKDMKEILNYLKSQNESNSTVNDINTIDSKCNELFLYDIKQFKTHFARIDFDNLKVPLRLKVILSRILRLNYYDNNYGELQEVKYDNNDAKNHIDGALTLTDISILLANKLLVDNSDRIKQALQPLFDYKYHRIYHLSTIPDNIYNNLLQNTPKSLTTELYNIIKQIRIYYCNGFTFYKYNKKRRSTLRKDTKNEYDIDWTMKTKDVLILLEKDILLTTDELSNDCDMLMNHFYSNLWDWFFIDEIFWKQLPYYNKYEIVRIRINDLMNQCRVKYYINNKPKLPGLWLKKYDKNLSIEQILLKKKKKKFSFDGLDYNDNIIQKIKKVYGFMNLNQVNILEFVSLSQIKDNELWTKFMNQSNIPIHIRFKISFFAIAGDIDNIEDEWLKNYIDNYPVSAPQYPQQIDGLCDITILDSKQQSDLVNVYDASAPSCDVKEKNTNFKGYIGEANEIDNSEGDKFIDNDQECGKCLQCESYGVGKIDTDGSFYCWTCYNEFYGIT